MKKNFKFKVPFYIKYNIKYKIIDIKSNEEYDFIYSLELLKGEAILNDLPWIPECLLVKRVNLSLKIKLF